MDKRIESKHLAARFGISQQAIYDRASALQEFLSPSANPAKGHKRWFTEHDVSVLTFADQMLDDNATFDDIRVSLSQPNVQLPPAVLTDEEISALMISDKESRAILQVQVLTNEVARLQDVNERLEIEAGKSREYREQVIRLEQQVEMVQSELERERENTPDVTDLYRQIGKLEAQIEFLREQLDK